MGKLKFQEDGKDAILTRNLHRVLRYTGQLLNSLLVFNFF